MGLLRAEPGADDGTPCPPVPARIRLRSGFIVGIGGDSRARGRGPGPAGPPVGRPTSGTEDVEETKDGSEIMCLLTDFFLDPGGTTAPGGNIGDGAAEPKSEGGPARLGGY